jgi:RNA polymerase sigma-70 factor (ECF subfamily)
VDGGRLVDRHLAGDITAFGELYARHANVLYRFIHASVGNAADAEDVLQNTFLAASRGIDSVKGRDNLRSWLFSIAAHQIGDLHRRNLRLPSTVGDIGDLEGLSGSSAAEEEVDRAIDSVVLQEGLRELSPRHRQALVLHHFDGLTFQEIAARLGTSTERVQLYVKQASARLSMLLSGTRPTPAPVRLPPAEPVNAYEKAIATLSPRRREVLERHVHRGLTPTRIATELGITANCARVNLFKALTELADRLGVDRTLVVDWAKRERAKHIVPTPRPIRMATYRVEAVRHRVVRPARRRQAATTGAAGHRDLQQSAV